MAWTPMPSVNMPAGTPSVVPGTVKTRPSATRETETLPFSISPAPLLGHV